jgi:hypothetical protein
MAVGSLSQLGIFPSEELAAIRQEYHILDGYNAVCKTECLLHMLFFIYSERQRLEAERSKLASPTSPSDSRKSSSHERREAELEFEFCERKLSILRARRMQLEAR